MPDGGHVVGLEEKIRIVIVQIGNALVFPVFAAELADVVANGGSGNQR